MADDNDKKKEQPEQNPSLASSLLSKASKPVAEAFGAGAQALARLTSKNSSSSDPDVTFLTRKPQGRSPGESEVDLSFNTPFATPRGDRSEEDNTLLEGDNTEHFSHKELDRLLVVQSPENTFKNLQAKRKKMAELRAKDDMIAQLRAELAAKEQQASSWLDKYTSIQQRNEKLEEEKTGAVANYSRLQRQLEELRVGQRSTGATEGAGSTHGATGGENPARGAAATPEGVGANVERETRVRRYSGARLRNPTEPRSESTFHRNLQAQETRLYRAFNRAIVAYEEATSSVQLLARSATYFQLLKGFNDAVANLYAYAATTEENDELFEYQDALETLAATIKQEADMMGEQAARGNSGAAVNQNGLQPLSLPPLAPPTFHGRDGEDFDPFYNVFLDLVHNNDTLTNVAKSRHLRKYLKDEALTFATGFNEDEYSECWEGMLDRFRIGAQRVRELTRELHSWTLDTSSPAAKRDSVSRVTAIIRCLDSKDMKQPDEIVIATLEGGLDGKYAADWAKYTGEKKLEIPSYRPTTQEMLKVLNMWTSSEYQCYISRASTNTLVTIGNSSDEEGRTFVVSTQGRKVKVTKAKSQKKKSSKGKDGGSGKTNQGQNQKGGNDDDSPLAQFKKSQNKGGQGGQGKKKNQSGQKGKKKQKCSICHKEHSRFKCEDFLKLSIKDRRSFLMRAQLCFLCFLAGHQSKDLECPAKKRKDGKYASCSKCKDSHNVLVCQED